MTAAITSDSKLFCPKRLLIGAYYPVRDVVNWDLVPAGIVRRDFRWWDKDTDQQLEPFVRFTGQKRAPVRGEFYISGIIPEGYYAAMDYKNEYPIGELVFVSRRTIQILTPFETP